jgi:hypothetical protein
VVILARWLASSGGLLGLRLAAGGNSQSEEAQQPEHSCDHSLIHYRG